MARAPINRGGNGPSRTRNSKTVSVPAPTGGLNAVDALAAMAPTDAITLTNWFSEPSYIAVRNGSSEWATGLPAWVETLMDYRSGTAHKIFGISGTAVYDVTASGAVGAAVVTGLTNARWEWTGVTTPGGQFLYAANATDKPLYFDGTSWVKVDGTSTPAITGVTTTTLRNPVCWKNRLWFIQDQTFNSYYLPIQSIGGAASLFPLGEVFRLGGSLQAIFTTSLNNGNTFDDYICFLSTEGELAMYGGTDPDFASTFYLAGVYKLGPPIGRRCWFRVGADVVIICADGFLPVSKIVTLGNTGQNQTISYKILNLVNEAVAAYSQNFGWEGQLYPIGNKIILNIPQSENSVQVQFVMNTINQSWGLFTGWNASTFLVSRETLYYGGDGVVIKADDPTMNTDNGADIMSSVQPAFNYFKSDAQKLFKMVRPIWQVDGALQPVLSLNTDFETTTPTGTPTYSGSSGAPWDTTLWDTAQWAQASVIQKNWQSIPGIGFSGTIFMNTSLGIGAKLVSLDYLFESGDGVF